MNKNKPLQPLAPANGWPVFHVAYKMAYAYRLGFSHALQSLDKIATHEKSSERTAIRDANKYWKKWIKKSRLKVPKLVPAYTHHDILELEKSQKLLLLRQALVRDVNSSPDKKEALVREFSRKAKRLNGKKTCVHERSNLDKLNKHIL